MFVRVMLANIILYFLPFAAAYPFFLSLSLSLFPIISLFLPFSLFYLFHIFPPILLSSSFLLFAQSVVNITSTYGIKNKRHTLTFKLWLFCHIYKYNFCVLDCQFTRSQCYSYKHTCILIYLNICVFCLDLNRNI